MSGTDSTNQSSSLKRNSEDVGWEYGILVDPKNKEKIQCILCSKIMSAGVYRIKQHIAQIKGNVTSCPKATKEDIAKCLADLEGTKKKKNEKLQVEKESREEVQILRDDDFEEIGSSQKMQHGIGPLDQFVKATRQQSLHDALDPKTKEKSHKVDQYVARWVYESGVPFHVIDNEAFRRMCEAIGQFGPWYKSPTQYMLRGPLLNEEMEKMKASLKKHEEEWELNGFSIMTDAWSDRKRRSVMNLCINCKEGTTFLSSREDSHASHTGQYIFEYVEQCIKDIGPGKVVQIVTDNASNNMAAKELLLKERPTIFWTSCATHTINLSLEGIGKLPKFKDVIDKAKAFTIFIYAHHKTLAMMRKATGQRDIVRPGITRFASSFLTLQSIYEKKEKLRMMMSSDEWMDNKLSKGPKGRATYSTIISTSFWIGVSMCLHVFTPLVRLLRLSDMDYKPSMGFLYGELIKAKEEVKLALKGVKSNYDPIIQIIEGKCKNHLDSPLHLTGYLLNPFYFYKDVNIQDKSSIMEAFFKCVDMIFPNDIHAQDVVTNVELVLYMNKSGGFGRKLALMGCENNDDNYDPVNWWSVHGTSTPNLQKMAKRILSLTTSSSGCERNWSTFEGIHTKKRNRLSSERLNNLVYLQFNAKCLNRAKLVKEKVIDVLRSNEANMAQAWVVEGGDEILESDSEISRQLDDEASVADVVIQHHQKNNIRELHEDDFISNEENVEEGDDEAYE